MSNKILIPPEFANARNVATKYRALGKDEEISVEVEGGFVHKKLSASAVVYTDANGREMVVFDDDEEMS